MTVLDGVVLLAAHTSRSQAYAQAMAREGLAPARVIAYGAPSASTTPPAPRGLDAGLPLADLAEPLAATCARAGWPLRSIETGELNDEAVVAAVAAARPRVLVFSSYGGQLAREPLLAAGGRVLHVHAGWLPDERGSTTVYYGMLAARRCAASALLLTPRIDAGPVLARREFPLPPAALDVDHLYDGAMRAAVLVDVLRHYARTGALPAAVCAADAPGTSHYVIHPVLKHLALLSR